jgi:serine phosphatase RsbU (regulator of sigma subunit)
MSLRTRLILAFFLLSVVPLAAVTFYSYTTNVEALREAARREADLLAGELGQRMQLVTAQLSERVEHLMDIAELQAAADAAAESVGESAGAAAQTAEAPTVTTVTTESFTALGDAAMLLNNVQLRNMRIGGRRGGGPAAGAVRPPPNVPTVGRAIPTSPATPRPSPTPGPRSRGQRPPPQPPATPPAAGTAAVPQTGPVRAAPAVTATKTADGRLLIDMGPVRRDLLRQVLPADRRIEDLSSEERQRLVAEVNQRLLGIQQGIQIGAAELQRQALAAEAEAAKRAAEATAAAPQRVAATTSSSASNGLRRRSTFSGRNIDVKVERNGEVVRSMNAEINLPNVLATVFSTTGRDHGEVPFAVATDGTIYARSEADKARIAAFGDVAKPDGPASVRLADWIIVTTEDQSGSGLRLGIARPVTDSLATLRRASARNAGLGLLFIGIALAGIVPLSSRLTRNLTSMGEVVGRFAHGDYRARVPVKSSDEVGQLALAFNQMAADVERHQHTAVEQERLRRELELGRQIQNEMLPHAPLTLGLTQVQGVSVPAREVGGDFFNYFVQDDGRIALLMGDVSGKGVGAALLMANIQASLKVRLGLGQGLADVADALDRDIEENSPGPVYATLFIGMLEPATRRLRYVNAGHNPQFVLRPEGRLEKMPATGLPVGLIAGRGYSEQFVQLAAGDVLFFYTDGCVETENEHGEMFGMERLEPLLVSVAQSPDSLHRVEDAITAFRGRTEPQDDATLMTVKVG